MITLLIVVMHSMSLLTTVNANTHKLSNIKFHKFSASYPNFSLSRAKVPQNQITT